MEHTKLDENVAMLVKEAMKSRVCKEKFKEFLENKRLQNEIKKIYK
ncbi:MAG: hypothetical protein ACQEWV_25160 [Bacillota bacterium]